MLAGPGLWGLDWVGVLPKLGDLYWLAFDKRRSRLSSVLDMCEDAYPVVVLRVGDPSLEAGLEEVLDGAALCEERLLRR